MKHAMVIAALFASSNTLAQQSPSPDRATLMSKCVESFSHGHAFKHLNANGTREMAIADRCEQEAEKYFPKAGTK
jgi:hypothetical protein